MLALVVLCLPASASALGQRGHVLGSSFGREGEGAGEFHFESAAKGKTTAPGGIAVDEASGDVYVVDAGNFRVQEFGPEGAFLRMWGWGVRDGKAEFEVCTAGCRAGLQGTKKGEFEAPSAIAVDNSGGGSGMVYVGANAGSKRPDVERFPEDGEEPLGRLPVKEEGALDGLAVDGHGKVWVYRGEEEAEGVIEGFVGTHPTQLEATVSSPLPCPKPGFGVAAGDEAFYVAHELLDGEGECPAVLERERRELKEPAEGKLLREVVAGKLEGEETVASRELDREATTGIAVDEASEETTPLEAVAKGDVYVDNGGSVAAFNAAGELVQRFGAGDIEAGMGVAVDSKTGDVYVVDAGRDQVEVFQPEKEAKPAVSGLSALDVSPNEAELSARVDPEGVDTHVLFQYGTADCVSEPAACTDVPAAPGTDLGKAFGDQSVNETLAGLAPGTLYHYRLVASNGLGSTEGTQTHGTFTTLPASAGLLADGRAWELVSPPEKHGAGIEPIAKEGGVIQASPDGEAITYVANGPIVAEPEGNRAPEPTQIISARTGEGWSSQDVVTPHGRGEGIESEEPWEFRFFSEDLALSLVEPPEGTIQPLEEPPLAPGASEKTLYVRAEPAISPTAAEHARFAEAQANDGFLAPGFAPLLTPADVTAEAKPGEKSRFGGELEFRDATADLSHVVFESGVTLLAGSAPGLYESGPGGGLELVSVLPDGAAAGNAELGVKPELGAEGTNVRGAVSEDGSRVFFYAAGLEEGTSAAESHDLYMRDTAKGETIQVNAAQGVTEPIGEESEVDFQAATPDGNRVFFTDTAPLTEGSNQGQELETDRYREADLYECAITERAGKLACDLTDLTPMPTGGSADVLNVIPGVSQDGTSIFFVANGVLAPGAKQGHCVHQAQETPPPEATCNLYEYRDGVITFIAALSNQDSGDWGSLEGSGRVGDFIENRPDLADLTARVSPNGEFFAFMSSMPLTGYDNLDAKSPGVRDQEVYLYDAATGLLTCVSCNPNGRSVGVHDIEASGEGIGLLVDRREDWKGQYLAGSVPGWTALGAKLALHQPRYLSDSGRLFFNSPDQLVPQAVNGKEDVYEYEPDTVGSCTQPQGCVSLISSGNAKQESAFLEASETGDSAFFLTAQPLVAADRDTNYDLYDARVCSGQSPCFTGEESSLRSCETASGCKTPPPPPTGFGTPASAIYIGPGNTAKSEVLGVTNTKKKPLTRAQQLADALRACKKRDRNRKKRLACEASARRHYAPKPKPKKPAKKGGK